VRTRTRAGAGQVYSKLAIVDLAGSERALKTKAQARTPPSLFPPFTWRTAALRRAREGGLAWSGAG
jgi:hypothetical protein